MSKLVKMDQKKTYQVTYKVYHNKRIKKISFHGKPVYPLYIRLTFDRRTTEYKSNLFDLFMKPKYGIRVSGEIYPPPLEEIIQREEKLIEFIIDKHPNDFSLELFKRKYDYYTRDLLDEMEASFLNYLWTFFQDEGMPYLADALGNGQLEVAIFDVIRDLRIGLKSDLYRRLIDHSMSYALPYYPLHQFAEQWVGQSLTALTMMDWEDTATKKGFSDFVKIYYPNQDVAGLYSQIDKWLKSDTV
jgi:hypothetical protein